MKSVSKKLLKAIEAVGGSVPKTGWNNFSKYKYITESDINQAVLPALIKEGLLLTTSVESIIETPSDATQKNRFCTVHLLHTIVDVETGETITLKSAGTAADTLDKSVYKAYTGACKYMMMKLFLISGDDSDPENDGVVPAVTKTEAAKPTQTVASKPSTVNRFATTAKIPEKTLEGGDKPKFPGFKAKTEEKVEY